MSRLFLRISPLLLVVVLAMACSRTPEKPTALVKGRITVDPKVDNSGDYSGIGVTIVFKKDTASNADTLFHAVTDTDGYFKGVARFEKRGQYPMIISRNNQTIATSSVILAKRDTVTINGQLPDFIETVKVKSRENTAYSVLQNVQSHYNRIVNYLNAGALPQDTIPVLMKTWAHLFWSVYKGYPGTIASNRAAVYALNLWQGLDDQKVLSNYDSLKANSEARINALNPLVSASAELHGLNRTVHI